MTARAQDELGSACFGGKIPGEKPGASTWQCKHRPRMLPDGLRRQFGMLPPFLSHTANEEQS